MQARRNFLRQMSLTMLGGAALPSIATASHSKTLPTRSVTINEKYWEMVKSQFAVPRDMLMVNAANLCPSPYIVNEKVQYYTDQLRNDVSFQYRSVFGKLRKENLEGLAKYFGIEKEEIGITRNTSESNNIIVNGLDFSEGDEVILWEQNHPTNLIAWQQRAKRYGFSVKVIAVPPNPGSKEELVDAFVEHIGPKTRLLSFSHISNVSGIATPAKEICHYAKEKGVLTLVDGAQSFGFLDLDLKDLGCSFYSGSAHKWFMGPMENGVLYVDKELLPQVHPNIIAAGWKTDFKGVDEKLCVLGQRNTPATAALGESLRFHNNIGKLVVEQRVRQLATYLKKNIQEKIPGVKFVTPLEENLSGGVVIFKMEGKDSRQVFASLYEKHGIAGAPSGGIRFSPNVYNTLEDMDRIIETLVTLD